MFMNIRIHTLKLSQSDSDVLAASWPILFPLSFFTDISNNINIMPSYIYGLKWVQVFTKDLFEGSVFAKLILITHCLLFFHQDIRVFKKVCNKPKDHQRHLAHQWCIPHLVHQWWILLFKNLSWIHSYMTVRKHDSYKEDIVRDEVPKSKRPYKVYR